ncbi:chemotaxis protein CheB [Oceanospirillum sediminis]|uniref:Chemotaxis protein n=1 Tax=Oceanospirillum sediminis TaxID=2760088 RepID=A0A839IRM2_9GAMM|nr:chemotaxis protein CheB [Oceanospirillum sediminis]MBB1487598.1 chemotaxis protein [Oceanospirillum sediminis]
MTAPCSIVAIAASAGGLEALLTLFSALPYSTQCCFIIAQHMAKEGHSDLVASLIRRETHWPVTIPVTTSGLKPGMIYLLPAGKNGSITNSQLYLSEPDAYCFSSPCADVLFTSLSQEQEKHTGIILSGAGSDGTKGLQALKHSGGTTFAQQPEEALFNSMPCSAITTGCIDYVLPLNQIAAQLSSTILARNDCSVSTSNVIHDLSPTNHSLTSRSDHPGSTATDELKRLIEQLRQYTGVNFSGYKEETLLRRLEKRKALLGKEQNGHYEDYVLQHPQELACLEQSLLVSVSSFFRDQEVFNLLHPLLNNLAGSLSPEPARILVAGCATGEEAWSHAILWQTTHTQRPLEILAIDLNKEAIDQACQGLYPEQSLQQIDKGWRDSFFQPVREGYQVRPELKNMVTFQQTDLLKTELSQNFDIISCRNLMIYLKRKQQDELIHKLHDALCPKGILVTGLTESLSPEGQGLFAPLDHYHRIYQRR